MPDRGDALRAEASDGTGTFDGPGAAGAEAVRAFVCAPPEDSRLFVAALPPGNPRGVEVVSFGGDAATLEQDVRELGVTLVVLSPQARNYSDELVARLSRHPDLLVVVGLVPAAGDWARQLTTAGALDVLRTPVSDRTIDVFVSSVPGWLKRAAGMRADPGWVAALPAQVAQAVQAMGYRQGVWAFWSPKGGAGKTTMACNVAALLGVVAQRRTLLADANMNGGHVDLHMGVETDTTIASLAYLAQARGELLPRHVQEHAVPWRAGTSLDILPGIQRVEQAGEDPLRGRQGETFLRTLLDVASRMYDFVVVDIGSSVNNPVHRAVLGAADGVVVVATPDRAALMDTRTTLATLESVMGLERSRYTLVVNMWTDQAGLRRGEITQFVGLSEAGLVPFEATGRMLLAVNTGEPFVLMNLGASDPGTQQVVDAMAGVAARVYPPLDTIWQQRGRRPSARRAGWFERLFG
jgi:MinD-like ATPase involved in chromosome partitioning or flagellar assembly